MTIEFTGVTGRPPRACPTRCRRSYPPYVAPTGRPTSPIRRGARPRQQQHPSRGASPGPRSAIVAILAAVTAAAYQGHDHWQCDQIDSQRYAKDSQRPEGIRQSEEMDLFFSDPPPILLISKRCGTLPEQSFTPITFARARNGRVSCACGSGMGRGPRAAPARARRY